MLLLLLLLLLLELTLAKLCPSNKSITPFYSFIYIARVKSNNRRGSNERQHDASSTDFLVRTRPIFHSARIPLAFYSGNFLNSDTARCYTLPRYTVCLQYVRGECNRTRPLARSYQNPVFPRLKVSSILKGKSRLRKFGSLV